MNPIAPQVASPADGGIDLSSLYDMVLAGGPVMIPIGLCSIVALAYTVERLLRLQKGRLGSPRSGGQIVRQARESGPEAALAGCRQQGTALGRVLAAALARASEPAVERERAAEDAGRREVKRLGANLRPLVVVSMIAPLLGLFGTVWGMILAFQAIALREGLGKPELLADGISQALITTAAGLAVAIPTQAVYYHLRSRIERFARLAEDVYLELDGALAARRTAA
jgi:biopolymer transport protein ExbB